MTISRRALLGGAVMGGAIMGGAAPLLRIPNEAWALPSRLEVVGNRLQAGGRPIRLIGVAVGDPIYIRKGRPVSDYVAIAEDWLANSVRISLHPGHWRADREAATQALIREVAAARALDLHVILCWHAIGFPDRYFEHPDPAWGLPLDAYESDERLASDFWGQMTRLFGRDPGVLFELWNEPVVDGKLWRSTGQHWPLLKSLWLRLIAVIRKSSDNIILVAGGRWAHDLKGVARDPIEDSRTIYTWHSYPPADRGQPGRWHDSLDGLSELKPVVVTEWGFCRNCGPHIRGTAEEFGIPFTRGVLDARGLHSTAWCWSPGAAPPMLEQDWATPTEYGRFVKSYLHAARRTVDEARPR
jgi:hypothetical protein